VPLSRRESVAGIVLGILGNAFVIVLGLLMPLDHPARDRVDNALIALGVIGVLITLLLPRSGLITLAPATRTALGIYGALSMASALLADFGASRRLEWAIKLVAAACFALAVRGLTRSA
jgi:purine-cytosine permease-like protein